MQRADTLPHREDIIFCSDLCGKRKERQSILGFTLPDPTANDAAEAKSSCVALSGKTPLHHMGSGRERPSGRRKGRGEARKLSRAERRFCGALHGVQSIRRTGGGRESRLCRFVGKAAGYTPVP